MKTKKTDFARVALLALLSMPFALDASAAPREISLGQDAISLTPIEGDVVSVSSMCPSNARCVIDGTKVRLRFTLLGCVDKLALTYSAKEGRNGELDVYVSALNVGTEASRRTRCIIAETQERTLSFPMQFGDVKVNFLTAVSPR